MISRFKKKRSVLLVSFSSGWVWRQTTVRVFDM